MINDLLDQASRHVSAPASTLAGGAWARAVRVRGRRRSVVAAVAVVALLSVTLTALHVGLPATERGGPDLAEKGVADHMPASPGRRALPSLPASGLVPPADRALPLTQWPATRAVAVVQPAGTEDGKPPMPLYVLDTDGSWRFVDGVALVSTRDNSGNESDPLRPTSISPSGRHIAVPQPDEVVIVDVTTGGRHRIALPGLNLEVVWRSDDLVLVSSEGVTHAVDRVAGTARPVLAGPLGPDLVAGPPDGPVLVLRDRELTERSLDDPTPVRRMAVDTSGLGSYRIAFWHGPAVGSGESIVRAGWEVDGAELVAVVDARTGVVRRLLDLGRGRSKSCCEPLAWVDDHTVLLRTDREGLLTWDVRDGQVRIVAGVGVGRIAVNFPGQR